MAKEFHIRISDQNLIDFIESKPERAEFIRSVIDDLRTGKLIYSNENSIDLETKKQKLRKLTAEAGIKEHELKYWDNFNDPPSPQAKKAITERALTKQQIFNVKDRIALRWDLDRFIATCPFCRNKFEYITENQAITDMARHFEALHPQQALK